MSKRRPPGKCRKVSGNILPTRRAVADFAGDRDRVLHETERGHKRAEQMRTEEGACRGGASQSIHKCSPPMYLDTAANTRAFPPPAPGNQIHIRIKMYQLHRERSVPVSLPCAGRSPTNERRQACKARATNHVTVHHIRSPSGLSSLGSSLPQTLSHKPYVTYRHRCMTSACGVRSLSHS